MDLLTAPFEVIESKIREQRARILDAVGLDPRRNPLATWVCRPNTITLFDPEWPEG